MRPAAAWRICVPEQEVKSVFCATKNQTKKSNSNMTIFVWEMLVCAWTPAPACVTHLSISYAPFVSRVRIAWTRRPCPGPPLAHGNRLLQLRFRAHMGTTCTPRSASSTWGLLVPARAASHARFTREPHARHPSSCSKQKRQVVGRISTNATLDLLLQHPDETLAIYVQNN
jgi:hypothetical protein